MWNAIIWVNFFTKRFLFISCNVFFSQEKSNFIKYEVSGEYFEPLDTQSINEFLIFDKNKYYILMFAFDDKRRCLWYIKKIII